MPHRPPALPGPADHAEPLRRLRAGLLAAGLALSAVAGLAVPVLAQATQTAQVAAFATFLEGLWPRARAAGVSRATFEAATGGLAPDPGIAAARARQPEFVRPISAYVKERVTPGRIARGRAEATRWSGALAAIARREGVPAGILVAIWGVETDFGRIGGGKDVIRSLATLAFVHPDRPVFADEFVAALVILQSGAVPRERLTGSWAGAMGQPQFMPSTYLAHAVQADGAGRGDIWGSAPDTLASIARLLHDSGWRPGEPWGAEVTLPPGFDYAAHRQSLGAWRRMGVRPQAPVPWPDEAQAVLYFPAGAHGPAFLLGDNFFVLKAYNTSDSYALSVGLLADAIAGAAQPPSWPPGDTALSRTDQAALQAALARLGFYSGPADGKIGPAMRDAIHAFQRSAGLSPADGHPSAAVLQAARAASGRGP